MQSSNMFQNREKIKSIEIPTCIIHGDNDRIIPADEAMDLYENSAAAEKHLHIIPGAGQFYTGHYFSGLLSLGWNALWGYLTVKAFIDERVFDGLIIGNFLWLRFYVGNIQNAEKFANEANIKIANKALSYLQDQYKGEKP